MKRFIVFSFGCLSFSLSASFDFKDVAGFQSCLEQKLVSVETNQGKETVKSLLTQNDIIIKCHKSSLDLLKAEKQVSVIKKYIEVVKTKFKKEEALPHLQLLVKLDVKECNTIENYEVMMAGFAHPESYPEKNYSYEKMAAEIASLCLKDPTFKSDFQEEITSSDTYTKANVCKILKSQKILTQCP
jgi:hypothetical protein